MKLQEPQEDPNKLIKRSQSVPRRKLEQAAADPSVNTKSISAASQAAPQANPMPASDHPKSSQSSPFYATVKQLWSAYDTENTGFVDKIEAQNLINDALVQKGKPKLSNFVLYNQLFSQLDASKEGQISFDGLIILLDTIAHE